MIKNLFGSLYKLINYRVSEPVKESESIPEPPEEEKRKVCIELGIKKRIIEDDFYILEGQYDPFRCLYPGVFCINSTYVVHRKTNIPYCLNHYNEYAEKEIQKDFERRHPTLILIKNPYEKIKVNGFMQKPPEGQFLICCRGCGANKVLTYWGGASWCEYVCTNCGSEWVDPYFFL